MVWTTNIILEFEMKILQIMTAAITLAASATANAWWGPFDNDNDNYHRGYNNNRWDDNAFGDAMSDI